MATNTMIALDKVTIGTATPTVTFTSIPQGYTDLVIIASGTASAAAYTKLTFNGDTATNYSATNLYGTGSGAGSARSSNFNYIQCYYNYANTNPTMMEVNIFNYSNTTTYKTTLLPDYDAAQELTAKVGMWRSTAAITSVTLERVSGNWNSGSTFSLYGIKAWTDETTPKATGGYVYSDSTYWYHAFPFSSTFTPNQSLTADILVVAGGGGGGNGGDRGAGGGGAGGLLGFTSQALSATGYSITVGSGGASLGSGYTTIGYSGNNSQFGALTVANGGGGGGCESSGLNTGGSGGSGGGGGASSTGRGVGGSATTGQGNAGGTASYNSGAASDSNGGGGGGAGAVGGSASNGYVNGAGGVGSSTYSSWGLVTQTGENVNGTVYYAGGGGAAGGGGSTAEGKYALGGSGGGGRGSSLIGGYAINGMVATGGGGGAQSWNGFSGRGGSGIVIVRYAK